MEYRLRRSTHDQEVASSNPGRVAIKRYYLVATQPGHPAVHGLAQQVRAKAGSANGHTVRCAMQPRIRV